MLKAVWVSDPHFTNEGDVTGRYLIGAAFLLARW